MVSSTSGVVRSRIARLNSRMTIGQMFCPRRRHTHNDRGRGRDRRATSTAQADASWRPGVLGSAAGDGSERGVLSEEFFKALKTGCIYQERELEDRAALLLALVFFLPIACQLMWLRSCSRSNPEASAEGLVNDVQMQVIRHFSSQKLSAAPSIRELVWAIAAIGGHIKNNGEPGWQVLGRAWQQILQLEHGWRAAVQYSGKL